MAARFQTAAFSIPDRILYAYEFARRTTLSGQRLVVWLVIVVSSFDVFAQTATTGALTGTVTDPSGAVVQNAKITLRNYGTDGTLATITGQDGVYRFSL